MFGSSRESLAGLRAAVQSSRTAADFRTSASQVLAVAGVLAEEKSLRQALADAGTASSARVALADSVFAAKVGSTCMDVLRQAISTRWSSDNDVVEGVETLGIQMLCIAAQDAGALDTVEEELFLFGRAVAGSPQLQMTLTDPSLPAAAKTSVVTSLLAGRGHEITTELLAYTVTHLRGKRLDAAIDSLVEVAADQRNRLVAQVTSAIALDEAQEARLKAALSTLTGRDINVNVVVDAAVIGGISVRIGDDLIDGTVASRMAAARRQLLND
jgi:F-type H+-transporting ATPase subunit delta